MSENDEAEAPARPLCITHGLRFDPALTRGCVLCRRPEALLTEAATERVGWTPGTLLLAIAVGLLVLALVRDLDADLAVIGEFARASIGAETATGSRAGQDPPATASMLAASSPPAAEQRSPNGAINADPPAKATACQRAATGVGVPVDDGAAAVGILLGAAARGDIAAMTQEIELGSGVDDRDSKARTALMLAARENRAGAIGVLCQYGSRVEARCVRGMTALHHAAESSACTEGLVRLLDAHADIEALDTRGASALLIAAHAGHAAVVRTLLDRGANMTRRDYQGLGVLDYVVMPRGAGDTTPPSDVHAVLQLLVDRKVDPRLGLDPATTLISFRAELDAWARADGRPTLPPYAEPAQNAQNAQNALRDARPDDFHGALLLFQRTGPADSRVVPTWLYPDAGIMTRGWVVHVPNILAQVRLRGLSLRSGQQVTLSADPAGDVPWEVDDALLIERMNGPLRVATAFVGRPDSVSLAQQPVQRLGTQALRYTRAAIDFTPWLTEAAGSDRVLISVIDHGGMTAVSDVYLHVMGPHAAAAIKRVEIDAMHPQ